MIANPGLASLILPHHSRFVPGEALRAAVVDELVVAKADQRAVHANPEIVFTIFEETPYPVTAVRGRTNESIVIEAAETSVGSDPEISRAILIECPNEIIGESVTCSEAPEPCRPAESGRDRESRLPILPGNLSGSRR